MLKILALFAAAPLALLSTLVAATGLLVVDVREGGPSGHHFIVPVPVVAAQIAARMIPHHETRLDVPEELQHCLPAARKMLEALADAPDGEFVRVEQRDERVVIRKVGGRLEVRVHGAKEEVAVDVPLRAVKAILDRTEGGRLTPSDLVDALGQARLTRLAEVQHGEDHVTVSVW